MLSFGERGYCNILHNFGNQHGTRSQQRGLEQIELNSNYNMLNHS
jgi:hypothetical protein